MKDQQNEIIDLLAKRFIARPDVHAEQWNNGGWSPKEVPFGRKLLQSHLDGKATLGHYMLSEEDECKLFAFDLDLDKPTKDRNSGMVIPIYYRLDDGTAIPINPREAWYGDNQEIVAGLTLELRSLAEILALRVRTMFDLDVAVAFSGNKGLHVYAFLGMPLPAELAIEMSNAVLGSFNEMFYATDGKNFYKHRSPAFEHVTVETFPKQAKRPNGGYGNLMKLPLGKDSRTGHKGFFVDLDAPDDVLQSTDPIPTLKGMAVQGV